MMILDASLHGLVEQNPPELVLKFIHYSLPDIIKEISIDKMTEPRFGGASTSQLYALDFFCFLFNSVPGSMLQSI